jgi:hypothetical protein
VKYVVLIFAMFAFGTVAGCETRDENGRVITTLPSTDMGGDGGGGGGGGC